MKKIICILLILFIGVSCVPQSAFAYNVDFITSNATQMYYSDTGEFFGSPTTIFFSNNYKDESIKTKDRNTLETMLNKIEEIDNNLSVSINTSDIAKFNLAQKNETIEISNITAKVIKIAKEMYILTEGLYNPCVYYYVDFWGLTPRFNSFDWVPTEPYDTRAEAIDQSWLDFFKPLMNFDDVVLGGSEGSFTLKKTSSPITYTAVDGTNFEYNLKIDLGGIGKGFAIDEIHKIAEANNIQKGYYNIGGSSQQLLTNPSTDSGKWELGVRNPRKLQSNADSSTFLPPSLIYINGLEKTAVSTSGDYEKFNMINGKRFCHIINGNTGMPVDTGICSVTVLGGSAAIGDVLTTTLMLSGTEKAIDFANSKYAKDNNLSVLFIREKFFDENPMYEIVTNLPDNRLEQLDNKYFKISRILVNDKIQYVPITKDDVYIAQSQELNSIIGIAIAIGAMFVIVVAVVLIKKQKSKKEV